MTFCCEINWEGRLSESVQLAYVKYYVKRTQNRNEKNRGINQKSYILRCVSNLPALNTKRIEFLYVCRHPETASSVLAFFISRSIQRSIELASLGRNLSHKKEKSAIQNELQP